jgi:hypothetical protein
MLITADSYFKYHILLVILKAVVEYRIRTSTLHQLFLRNNQLSLHSMSLYTYILYLFRWVDPASRSKTPNDCSGPQYVSYVLHWVESVLADESVFPSTAGEMLFTYIEFEAKFYRQL